MWTKSFGYRFHAIGSSRVYAMPESRWESASWCVLGLAAGGNTAGLRAMWARGTYMAFPALGSYAAAGDHTETLEWLLQHGVECDAEVLAASAAAGGATAVLQRVWDSVGRPDTAERREVLCGVVSQVQMAALQRATEDTRALEWLLQLPGVRFPNLADADVLLRFPAAAGNLGALRWLHEAAGVPVVDLGPARAAAAGGHLGVLAYLKKVGPAFDGSVAEAARDHEVRGVRDASRWATEKWLAEEAGCVAAAPRASARAEAKDGAKPQKTGGCPGASLGALARACGAWGKRVPLLGTGTGTAGSPPRGGGGRERSLRRPLLRGVEPNKLYTPSQKEWDT
jgi:hypothetical protein